MTASLTCIGEKFSGYDINFLVETINPLKTLDTKILNVDQGFFAVSFHQKAPLKGDKYFNDDDWMAVFAGDIIDESVPWNFILNGFEKNEYQKLDSLRGYFAITVLDKKKNKLFLVSDRASKLPVFYLVDGRNVCLSTELSSFCRLPVELSFNIKWLWEYLFFHYPIGQTTFFENVYRMPPASVLEVDLNSGDFLISEYASKFQRKRHLLKGEKALEFAYGVFKDRVPKYFSGSDDIVCPLTGGWDSRTNLVFCPDINSIKLFTYGIPESWDLVESSKTVKLMGGRHQKILFDKDFEDKLPSIIIDAIYLSSGLERVRRSAIFYVYKSLADSGSEYPVLIEGLDYDGLFRGHNTDPAVKSHDIIRMFSTGDKSFNEIHWMDLIGDNYESFKKHVLEKIDFIEKNYGMLSSPDTHLSFVFYESSAKYWAGLVNIAKYFSTLRVPAWDEDIMDLSCSIEYSTLLFSNVLGEYKRGCWEETVLQAYLFVNEGGPLKDIAIRGVSPETILKGKIIYNFIRLKNLIPNAIKMRILRRSYSPENWDRWLNEIHIDFIDYLIFSEDSRIKKYFEDHVFDKLKENRDIELISKFSTVEIILRLMENSWDRHGKNLDYNHQFS